jgi:hypothetical protein
MMDSSDFKPLTAELTLEQIDYISSYLVEFFKEEPAKAVKWLLIPNPMFGGISANSLIAIGRGYKVIEFMKAAKEGNQLP